MSAAQKLKDLQLERAEAFAAAKAAVDDEAKFGEAKAKVEKIDAAIERQKFLLDAEMAEPVASDPERDAHEAARKAGKPGVFKSLGEQLQAVHRATTAGRVDPRLFQAAGQGMNEETPDAGGFAVQSDFASEILKKMYDVGQILSRVRRVRVQGNGIEVPAVDETSRATGSRLGGLQGYWVNEGGTITSSRPKIRTISMKLQKVAALGYATDELLQDAPALSGIMDEGAREELLFLTEDAIVNGDGVGKPLGYMNATCLVTQAAVSGQGAGTIVWDNLASMFARAWARGRVNGIWTINQDVEPQLNTLTSGGTAATYPVYMPPGGVSAAPYGSIYGRPVIPVEYNATLGTAGDIAFLELDEYLLIEKAGIESASSMHVAFSTAEQAFRFVYRVNGQPIWNSALTPFKGSNTQSPFVVLSGSRT